MNFSDNIPDLIDINTGKNIELDDVVQAINGKKYRLKGILYQENKWVVWVKGIEGSLSEDPSFISCRLDFH